MGTRINSMRKSTLRVDFHIELMSVPKGEILYKNEIVFI